MRAERPLLTMGVLMPVLYFGTLLVAAHFYPGYDPVRQYASELGGASAKHPQIFNIGTIAVGVAAGLAGLGFCAALCRRSGTWFAPTLTALAFIAWGAGMVLAGLFPMPDLRHGGFGLGLAYLVTPLTMLWALWNVPGTVALKLFLAVALAAMATMFAIMMGVGRLVHVADVGLWQRGNALATFPWVAVAALALMPRRG